MTFHQQLVLKKWMHRFFRGDDLQKLKERLGDDRYEGIEDGHTLFFGQLTAQLFDHDLITAEELARYDQNIVRHWQEITRKRNRKEGESLRMKYFQYLSLLFSEIYLDWFFQRPADLLAGLNEELARYNDTAGKADQFVPYLASDLNKIAFWNATGSGKTLLLHVNILQYLERFAVAKPTGKSVPDKIIILTPNEGLSRQHLRELGDSGFGSVTLFDKDHNSIPGTIEIIDVNKLGDEMSENIVAVEAFEGHNLVLVDEGHRGTGTEAGAWMRRRAALISKGFAFEYSATFGQSVAKGNTILKSRDKARKEKAKIITGKTRLADIDPNELNAITLDEAEETEARFKATLENYAKCCLFDYSYKYFYDDGYGKEFTILNLPENKDSLPLKMRPLSFDAPSEVQFVQDLEAHVTSEAGKKQLGDKSLYLLRNASDRRKGVGFAIAGNFYPDFLLWLTCPTTGKQWLSFVDPKGLKKLDLSSPKFQLYREIKTVEKELKDPDLTLNSFILSITKYDDLVNITNFKTMEELEESHVLFMLDKPETYVEQLLNATLCERILTDF